MSDYQRDCGGGFREGIAYNIVVAINNPYTNCPVTSAAQARVTIERICGTHFERFLIVEGDVGYRDKGKAYVAVGFDIQVINVSEADVRDCAAILNRAFGQNQVLITKQPVAFEFYRGRA